MRSFLLIVIIIAGIGFFTPERSTELTQVVISGTVTDAQSNQAIAGVHIFSIAGEEEAFTDRSGKFKIQSWKKFPLTIHAEHKDYQKQIVQVNAAGELLNIKLKKR